MSEEKYYNLFDLSKEKLILKIKLLQQENQQLKEVIEELREYINNLSLEFYDYECNQLIVGKYMIDDLLQILDKAKEN